MYVNKFFDLFMQRRLDSVFPDEKKIFVFFSNFSIFFHF